jgi:curli biogenesis system outer membrane secretion channel CsgG
MLKSNNTALVIISCVFIMLHLCGCVHQPVTKLPSPDLSKHRYDKLVAVAGFENRSTYSADKLWDTSSHLLTTQLIEKGYFRVVEWERMKQLFDWDLLSTAALVQSPVARNEAKKILLCEYFMGGAVTSFNVDRTARVSALSKAKSFTTSIRVDLWLQDAQTGEYLSASSGQGMSEKIFRAGIAGGQSGTWDPHEADQALYQAISEALDSLVMNYHRNISGRQVYE